MPSAIEEKDATREVLAEYCFALDGGRYDDMAALFTEDGAWDTAFGAATGRAAIAGQARDIRVRGRRQPAARGAPRPTSSSRWRVRRGASGPRCARTGPSCRIAQRGWRG